MSVRALVTNQQVGTDIGATHSMVSRIRSGDRLPSFELMRQIETQIGWSMTDQTDARLLGSYAQEFESALAKNYAD